jgi:PAS domain S-box-containing protein
MTAIDQPTQLEEFQRLLAKLPVAAYTCDVEGLVTFYNRHAVEVWGREPRLNHPQDRYCGSFRLYTPEGDPVPHEECWMALALRENKAFDGHEIVIERADGGRCTVLAYANPIHDEVGRLIGAVNVLMDITGRKQSENILRQADRRKNEFLAMLAHELRNPLAPIRSGLDVLALAESAERDTIELMQQQVEHLVRLVDDLLDVSRIVRGQIELRRQPVELADVVGDAVRAIDDSVVEHNHRLTVSLPKSPVWLNADPVRLKQVVQNLLKNSCKYTDRGGKIELTARQVGGEAEVRVVDDGVGIDPELLPHVFEMFAQSSRSLDRAQGGLGIGLMLVRSIVERHGGSVSAHSNGPGQGSEFCIRLPVCAAPGSTPAAAISPALGRPCRILAVDDNPSAAWLLAKLLGKLGPHEIETAHDGPSTLDKFAAFAPEMVLLDIGLPGMDGYEVAATIRASGRHDDVLLVALTGYGQEEDRIKSQEAGFDLHLVKPPAVDQLRQLFQHTKLTRA